jgi:hypothetical protein
MTVTDLPSLRLADYVLGWTVPEKCGLRAECLDCGSRNVRHDAIRPCTDGHHLCNARGWGKVPSNADVSNRLSLDIAAAMLDYLGIGKARDWQARQTGAAALEKAVAHFTSGDGLTVRRGAHLSEFAQYRHLRGLPDDRLNLDIAVSRDSVLLAVLELKTTLRSDRGRGAIGNLTSALTQHSGTVIPLAAVVTAEPLPARLAACAPKTGGRHAVYHVSRPALAHAVEVTRGGQYAEWRIAEKHIHDFGELFAYLRTAAA